MAVKQVSVELGWGPAKLKGVWEPDLAERNAAWELYVELVTRIAVVPLRPGDGILREALTSLYQLFGHTREILRKYGPDVARPARAGRLRFGYLAIWVLNGALRPTLALWHPELQRWEAERPADRAIADHEAAWPRAAELRADLEETRKLLLDYARLLAEACDAPALIDATDEVLSAMDEQAAQG
jgi:hypothetical protein